LIAIFADCGTILPEVTAMDEIKIEVRTGGNLQGRVDFDLTAGHTPKIIGADRVFADFINLPPRREYSVRIEVPGYEPLVFWQGERLTCTDEGIAVFDFFMPDDLYNTAPHVHLLQVNHESRPQNEPVNLKARIDWSKPILPVKPLVTVHSYRFVPQVSHQMGDISKILRVV
jgi:hypothetical protein